MNVCSKFHNNMISCWDITRKQKTKHRCHLHVGISAKVRGSSKSLGFILWGPWMFVPSFMAILTIVVEIVFQSEPDCLTDYRHALNMAKHQIWYICISTKVKNTLKDAARNVVCYEKCCFIEVQLFWCFYIIIGLIYWLAAVALMELYSFQVLK